MTMKKFKIKITGKALDKKHVQKQVAKMLYGLGYYQLVSIEEDVWYDKRNKRKYIQVSYANT